MSNPCVGFNPLLLLGTWDYTDAHTEFPDGTIGYNFTPHPRGRFIIMPNGRYSHIVMSPDLPRIASGQLKVQTDAEAQQISTNILAHFGTWEAQSADGTFSVVIDQSSFPNFDGITQTRIITQLDHTILSYKNLQASNGGDAVIVASLQRVPLL